MARTPEASTPRPGRWRRRGRRAAIVALVLLLAGLLALRVLLQPERVVRTALEQAGNALGLEITASGAGEYRLRGTPTLVARDVVARVPGADAPLLTADRVAFSLPWSTLRDRFRELEFTRIELDAPVIDLSQLQAWRETRPPGTGRIATLREGLAVTEGRIVASNWTIEGFAFSIPMLRQDARVAGPARGTWVVGDTRVPFDLQVVLARAAARSPLGAAGRVTVERPDWSVPAHVVLSGVLDMGDGGWRVSPITMQARARHVGAGGATPFVLGMAGTLDSRGGRTVLSPLGVALRRDPAVDPARDLIPVLESSGALTLEEGLVFGLEGEMAAWPEAWPPLPVPLAESRAPIPFALSYSGATSLADPARLRLRRDGADFDGHLRLADLTAWIDEDGRWSPLPPIDGSASIPEMELGGATLHGVELSVDDPALESAPAEPADD
jgi:hypothetical protein